MENGAAALKTGFEKAVKGYDAVLGYGKDTAEACMKSATVAGKGVETINSEIYSYSKQSIEDSIAASQGDDGLQVGARSVRTPDRFRQVGVRSLCRRDDQDQRTGHRRPPRKRSRRFKGRVQAWVDVVQTARAA